MVAATAAVLTAVAAAGSAYSSIKQAETAEKAQKEQAKLLEEQNKAQADEIKQAKAEALAKRKDVINKQRKQIFGAGDTTYDINMTGAMGVMGNEGATSTTGGSITGAILG